MVTAPDSGGCRCRCHGVASRDRRHDDLEFDRRVGGVTLFRFVEPFKDVSPQERVSIIYQRLWYVLDSTVPERRLELRDQVRVDKIRADMCIFVGDYLIVTIDEVHARINRCSPQELAEVWLTICAVGCPVTRDQCTEGAIRG